MHAIRNDWNMPHLVGQQTLVMDRRFPTDNCAPDSCWQFCDGNHGLSTSSSQKAAWNMLKGSRFEGGSGDVVAIYLSVLVPEVACNPPPWRTIQRSWKQPQFYLNSISCSNHILQWNFASVAGIVSRGVFITSAAVMYTGGGGSGWRSTLVLPRTWRCIMDLHQVTTRYFPELLIRCSFDSAISSELAPRLDTWTTEKLEKLECWSTIVSAFKCVQFAMPQTSVAVNFVVELAWSL